MPEPSLTVNTVAQNRPPWSYGNMTLGMLRRIAGWSLCFVGFIGLAGQLGPNGESGGSDASLAMAGALVAFGGLLILMEKQRPSRGPMAEQGIFALAKRLGGRVTAGELAADQAGGYDVATAMLESLADRGACQRLVNDDGVTVYRFPEFEAGASKRDLLEP